MKRLASLTPVVSALFSVLLFFACGSPTGSDGDDPLGFGAPFDPLGTWEGQFQGFTFTMVVDLFQGGSFDQFDGTIGGSWTHNGFSADFFCDWDWDGVGATDALCLFQSFLEVPNEEFVFPERCSPLQGTTSTAVGTIDEAQIVLQLEDWELHEGEPPDPSTCADFPLVLSWSAGQLTLIKQ